MPPLEWEIGEVRGDRDDARAVIDAHSAHHVVLVWSDAESGADHARDESGEMGAHSRPPAREGIFWYLWIVPVEEPALVVAFKKRPQSIFTPVAERTEGVFCIETRTVVVTESAKEDVALHLLLILVLRF